MMLLLTLLTLATAAPDTREALPDKEVKLGSRLAQRNHWGTFSPAQVRDIQDKYGKCVVKKRAGPAAQFVLNSYDERERRRLVQKVIDGHCLIAAAPAAGSVQMKFPGEMMRFALADALVQRELLNWPVRKDLASVPPLDHGKIDPADFAPPPGKRLKPDQLAELQQDKLQAQSNIYLSSYGECIVRANAEGSKRLLSAAPATPSESHAFAALQPVFANCLDAGRTLELNKTTLRGTIALNYYRLAKAPIAPQPPVGAVK